MSGVTHYNPLQLKGFLSSVIKWKAYFSITSYYGSKILGHLHVGCRDKTYDRHTAGTLPDQKVLDAEQLELYKETVKQTKAWFALNHPELRFCIKREDREGYRGFFINNPWPSVL